MTNPDPSDLTLGKSPSAEAAATVSTALREGPGARIGPYKLLQLIGEGGFGSVFMAEQEQPVQRKVALKIIKLGMDTRQVVARFEQERQALALMDHPNIARVLDAGATDTGRPYFVMELVKGDPIVEYCDKNSLRIDDRLELFVQVCNAVQHAHTKGIIHRDIKPSNILVSAQDGRPNTKVIDFGVAKATSARLTALTLFTEQRQLIGTPEYMSPEQAEGNLDIDTRTDVYSLGVLLYELLTGTTPFSTKELRSAGYAEIQRIIREVEPPKPSSRLSKNTTTIGHIAARRQTEPRKLGTIVRGELDWIVMKALEKNRTRRYETANGLALDIRRHLAGEAVVAAPPSAAYQFKKFMRRHRVMVAAGAAVAGALVVGIIGTTLESIQAMRARVDADRNALQAHEAEAAALLEKANALQQAYSANMLSASDALERGQFDTARHYLDRAPRELRGWEWRHLLSRLDLSLRVHEHRGPAIVQLIVSPDARSYYTIRRDRDRPIQRWDVETGQLLQAVLTGQEAIAARLLDGGDKIALYAATQSAAGPKFAVEVWDLRRGEQISSIPAPAEIQFSRSGTQAVFVQQEMFHVIDIRTGAVRSSPAGAAGSFGPFGYGQCMQPDGRRLASYGALGEICLLDTDSFQILSRFQAHDNYVASMDFSPDATRLVSSSMDNTIRITNVLANPPEAVATLRAHAIATSVSFSPDGSLIASLGEGGAIRLWDGHTGSPRGVFEVEGSAPTVVSFFPDGQTLISSDAAGTVRFWDVRSADAWVLRGHQSYAYPVLLSPDGATIYSGGWDGFVGQPGNLRFWDAETGDPIAAMGAPDECARAAALTSDGKTLAVSFTTADNQGGHIDLLDTATGATIASIADSNRKSSTAGIDSLAFDPTGRKIVWVDSRTCTMHVADARTGGNIATRTFTGELHVSRPRVAWSPDGATIAFYLGVDPVIEILDAQSLVTRFRWSYESAARITYLAYSPDGRRILAPADDGNVGIWEVARGARLHDLVGHANRVLCALYSPDGKRIATGGNDGSVRLWDAESFEPVARLGGHEDYVYSLAWRADSQMLVSTSGDHSIRIWDTTALKDRVAARRARQKILSQVEPLVQRLFDGLPAADRVVDAVTVDAALTPRARQVALQVVLRNAIERRATAERLIPASAQIGDAHSLTSASANSPGRYRCAHTSGRITVDGRIDETAWNAAPWSEPFVDIEGDVKPRPRFETRMKMLWDDEYLYIAARLDEPHVWAALTNRDDIVFQDNDFEVFVDPDGHSRWYGEVEVNALATIFDLRLDRPYSEQGTPHYDWSPPGLKAAVSIDGTLNDPSDTDRGWTVEIAIPHAAFADHATAPIPPRPGDIWRINFSRVEWLHDVVDGHYVKRPETKEDNWVWTPQHVVNMHVPREWGFVEFMPSPQ